MIDIREGNPNVIKIFNLRSICKADFKGTKENSKESGGKNWIPKVRVIMEGLEEHIKESTNECINKWNNKSMSLSPYTHTHTHTH